MSQFALVHYNKNLKFKRRFDGENRKRTQGLPERPLQGEGGCEDVGSAVGLRPQVVVHPSSDDSQRFQEHEQVVVYVEHRKH